MAGTRTVAISQVSRKRKKSQLTFKRSWQKYKYLYLLLLPGTIYLVIFKYLPMYGLGIAFQDYTVYEGVLNSPFVGMEKFRQLMSNQMFWKAFGNTVRISLLRLLFGFPAPILFALLLNELAGRKFRRVVQSVSYLPHFISWVILAGVLDVFINNSNGVIMVALRNMGITPPDIMTSNTWFVPMLIVTGIYKSMGYGAIVYLAAITGVDPGLYESAVIDGAGRFRLVWNITIPSIMPVICIMFILNLGSILEGGFDQIFVLYNPMVYRSADIIDTFVYRMGIVASDYSIGAAAQFFKSIISMLLIVGGNTAVKRMNQASLW